MSDLGVFIAGAVLGAVVWGVGRAAYEQVTDAIWKARHRDMLDTPMADVGDRTYVRAHTRKRRSG